MAEEGSWGLTHRCLNLPRLLVKCKRKRALKIGQFCSVQIYFEFIIQSRCSFPGEIKKREDFSPIWAAINLSLQRPGVHPDNYTSYLSFNFDQILKLKYLSILFFLHFQRLGNSPNNQHNYHFQFLFKKDEIPVERKIFLSISSLLYGKLKGKPASWCV